MDEQDYTTSARTRNLLVVVAIVLAFGAAYGYAVTRGNPTPVVAASAAGGTDSVACDGTGDGSACGVAGEVSDCSACDSSTEPPAIDGTTAVDGTVQTISVDVSKGYFDPSIIRAKAGVPIEITFGEGSGCMAEVMFKDFSVFEDLTSGGATVELPALDPGEYTFSCGMEMVYGNLIVE